MPALALREARVTPEQIDEAIEITMALILRFEGMRLKPYLCPAGVPTLAAGITHYLDGRRVTLADPPLSREAALRLTRLTLEGEFMPAVRVLFPGADTPGRLAAVGDATFNLGAGAMRSSTLRRKVNAAAWSEVPAEFRRWVNCAGHPLRGLIARREAEIALI